MNEKMRALELLRIGTADNKAEFRDDQWEAIKLILAHRRVLLVEATGWGKSYVYFIAAKILREKGNGPAILISPLISLMRNQLKAAEKMGIKADTINSTNLEEWAEIYMRLFNNEIDILLISPERLSNADFLQFLLENVINKISFIIIDEAHCISDWGHDFRPDYQRIKRIINYMPPDIAVLATTATANNRVVEDIKTQLKGNLVVIRGRLMRKSIHLQNRIIANPYERMVWLAEVLKMIDGSGIVYVLTRRYCDIIADWLKSQGISAAAYHSKIEEKANISRKELENKFQKNEVKVLVATVALGMGYDKPDISFVIHFHRPASVIHYYQQVGRAGRSLEKAYGILLQGDEDKEINDYFIDQAYPVQENINKVLKILENNPDGLSKTALKIKANLQQTKLDQVLKILLVSSPSPITRENKLYYRNGNPYIYPLEKVNNLKLLRQQEQDKMINYMNYKGCLMRFLAEELDDPYQNIDCGKCNNCIANDFFSFNIDRRKIIEAEKFVRNKPLIIAGKKIFPRLKSMRFYTFIPYYLEKNGLMLEEGRILCRYHDPGLGKLVSEGKYKEKRFSDILVQESVELIKERWFKDNELPFNWLTCIPSAKHPRLVPDFTKRLADALSLPFSQAVTSTGRKKHEQKSMNNYTLKLLNLDGEYEIDKSKLIHDNVLIVDDMVESAWTLTLAGILLKVNGLNNKVFPYALATTREF